MTKISYVLIVFPLLLCAALAQTGNDASPATDVRLSTQQPEEPTPVATDFFGAALSGHWTFTTELNLEQEYDDNVFSSGILPLSDNISRLNARFTAAVQKKRLRMQVHYYPNYVFYSKYSDRN